VTVDVVTDLIGEIVEVHEWDHKGSSLRGRGTARAVYIAGMSLLVLVEHNLGYESQAFGFRAEEGGLEAFSFENHRVRVVQRCSRCIAWDQKARLFQHSLAPDGDGSWEHKDGEGCKKVGHGG